MKNYTGVIFAIAAALSTCLPETTAADEQASQPASQTAKYPPPAKADDSGFGEKIQRTMTLLATSTPEKPNTVKILFYGQSITKQDWSKMVADDLRKRFPSADLIIENRAIGGFASQMLKSPAEHDLYPFYPDLLIFHVYGSNTDYEKIIEKVRKTTTAEILLQTDHGYSDKPNDWGNKMSFEFIPGFAKKYGCELCDIRRPWKQYCMDNNVDQRKLTADGTHLNNWGNYLMAELVKRYLRYDPKFSDTGWKDMVKTFELGKDAAWKDGRLEMEFEGNRVDVIYDNTAPADETQKATIMIDGKKPSEFPALYVFSRPNGDKKGDWPWDIGAMSKVTSKKPLLLEDWTITLTEINNDGTKFKFSLAGSKTGPDGEGSNDKDFVSNSGRVVIESADWHLNKAYQIKKTVFLAGYKIEWRVVPMFRDDIPFSVGPDKENPARERAVTIVQGLANEKHKLEIICPAKDHPAIKAIRVYKPPVK